MVEPKQKNESVASSELFTKAKLEDDIEDELNKEDPQDETTMAALLNNENDAK